MIVDIRHVFEKWIVDNDIETFHIHFVPDNNFTQELSVNTSLNQIKIERISKRASGDGVFFLESNNTILISSMSVNNLAEAAGYYLNSILAQNPGRFKSEVAEFYSRVFKSAIGMIASKILNPRRKCLEIKHRKNILQRAEKQNLRGIALQRMARHRAIVEYHEWFIEVAGQGFTCLAEQFPSRTLLDDEASNYEISRSIGQILGIHLFHLMLSSKVPIREIRRIFRKKIRTESAMIKEVYLLHLYLLGVNSKLVR